MMSTISIIYSLVISMRIANWSTFGRVEISNLYIRYISIILMPVIMIRYSVNKSIISIILVALPSGKACTTGTGVNSIKNRLIIRNTSLMCFNNNIQVKTTMGGPLFNLFSIILIIMYNFSYNSINIVFELFNKYIMISFVNINLYIVLFGLIYMLYQVLISYIKLSNLLLLVIGKTSSRCPLIFIGILIYGYILVLMLVFILLLLYNKLPTSFSVLIIILYIIFYSLLIVIILISMGLDIILSNVLIILFIISYISIYILYIVIYNDSIILFVIYNIISILLSLYIGFQFSSVPFPTPPRCYASRRVGHVATCRDV